MPAWYVAAGLWVAGSALYSLITKPASHPARPDREFRRPTTREGERPLIGFGTFRIDDPAVLWFGDVRTQVIERNNIPIGVKYFAGVNFGLCLGDADIYGVYVDGRYLRPTAVQFFGDFWRLNLNSPRFFGGEEQSGGIVGDIDVYRGSWTQSPSDYLQSKIDPNLSAYRGLCHAVARGIYWGMNGSLPSIAFVLQSFPNELGLPDGHHLIPVDGIPIDPVFGGLGVATDANPACVIYRLLTAARDVGGAGLSPTRIHVASLRALGELCWQEKLGISGTFDVGTVRSRVEEILRTIDAMWYVDPATGLLTFRSIRDDYDPAVIPRFDDSSIRGFRLRPMAWSETANMVQVRYTDRARGFIQRSTMEIDRAGLDVRNGQGAPIVVDLPLITRRATAQWAAGRLRAARGWPKQIVSFKIDRTAYSLRRGDAIRIDYAPFGVSGLIARVTRISYGTLALPEISIDAVTDDFSAAAATFSPPPPGEWSDPGDSPVAPVSSYQVIEAPYGLVRSRPLLDELPYGLALAVPGSGPTLGWRPVTRRRDGTWTTGESVTATPIRGTLAAAVAKTSSSIRVVGDVGLDLLRSIGDAEFAGGVNLLWLADEFVAFRDVLDNGDGSVTLTTLARGCLDTTPQLHSLAKEVWFLTRGWTWVDLVQPVFPETTYATHVLFQSFNGVGDYDLSVAPKRIVSVSRPTRSQRPALPGLVLINGSSYPATITGGLSLSWSHRDRLTPASFATSNATSQSENGTTYTIEIYGESGGLVHRQTGLGSLGWSYDQALEIAESGLGRLNRSLRIVLVAVRDGVDSHQRFDHTLARP